MDGDSHLRTPAEAVTQARSHCDLYHGTSPPRRLVFEAWATQPTQ